MLVKLDYVNGCIPYLGDTKEDVNNLKKEGRYIVDSNPNLPEETSGYLDMQNQIQVFTTKEGKVWVRGLFDSPSSQVTQTRWNYLANGNDVQVEIDKIKTELNEALDAIIKYLHDFLPKPEPDDLSNGLPVYYRQGSLFIYDGDIGKIFPAAYPTVQFGELLCDGTRYLRSGTVHRVIPNIRLANRLWNDEIGYYQFGTGTSFVTVNLNSNNQLILTTNRSGAARISTPETSGFTVEGVFKGNDYGVNAYLSSDYPNRVYVQGKIAAGVTPPDDKISGFNIVPLRNGALVKQLFYIEGTDAKNLRGKWFQFSNTTNTYGVWFTVDGQGTNPVPSNLTAIAVSLLSTQTARDVAIYLAEFLGGHQLTRITCVDASTIKPGDYWIFSTSYENFNVFAKVNGQGKPPPISGTNIPVDFIGTETMPEVAQKIKIAINQFCFAVPDLRDAFIRGWDKDGSVKVDDRYFNYGQGLIGNGIGSFQFDEILIHSHPSLYKGQYLYASTSPSVGSVAGNYYSVNFSPNTGDRGGVESRSSNFAANFVIKC
ncbi:hypothetical protein [Rickettsiella endosymbiont of Dermanyssus gallinae]|uniref:hypothetical protein n=1 Tax=Rickettsiella endosymbiont of Dermanyssus gallinae TaxID=2856608 RepID=UPI001C533470|nr:hypothetical protein [Rickettsiella endosymbiont of Dermanyssus gallinae]